MIGYYPINPAGGGMEEDAFGPRFFRTHFFDRMKQVCQVDDQTPVIEIVLTSGQVLDVSHIIELKSDFMLVNIFVDARDCENTYNAFIRYITIYRINVHTRPQDERAIGFNNREPISSEDTPRVPKQAPTPDQKPGTKRRKK
ncbi:MAG: hypothetical protein IT464_14575 [Planctomycetes bacterium]|nr:hypothetical protein [Planctomycetota bacterium]